LLALDVVDEDADERLSLDELDELDAPDAVLDSVDEEPEAEADDGVEPELGPFALALEARESLIYQPLPLNTMPTG
jgi:hypothetical protein